MKSSKVLNQRFNLFRIKNCNAQVMLDNLTPNLFSFQSQIIFTEMNEMIR